MSKVPLSIASRPPIHAPVPRMLTDAEIPWDLPPARTWPDAEPVIEAGIAAISLVTDEVAARVITTLLETIVDLREQVGGLRRVLVHSFEQAGRAERARRAKAAG